MERIEKFIRQDDIDHKVVIQDNESTDYAVKLENMDFSWGFVEKDEKKSGNLKENDNSLDQSLVTINNASLNDESAYDINTEAVRTNASEFEAILKDISLFVHKGEFVGIIGEVGAGKSSLLQAILNNMILLNNEDKSKKITVNGSISYVSQVAWIQNATLKNNILFNNEYDEARYLNTIKLCELQPDIESLVGGDMTEIGEKGINLSGGQKARLAIARAVYAEQDIYLFDDPISALDANVGQKIMQNLINGHLKHKTRLLVTHALQYLSYVDRIVYMKQGRILWEGTYNELITQEFYTDLTLKKRRFY